MSPRMQIIRDEQCFTLIGDFDKVPLSLEDARDYFNNWLDSYPSARDDNFTYYIQDKEGKKSELKLQ